MLAWLNHIDTQLFLFLNNLHSPALDSIMLAVSYNKLLFALILTAISIYGILKLKKFYLLAFLFCLIGFGLSDAISTRVFKNNFKRLRPCHNEVLKNKVHLAGQNCWGGKYGFVSSHASNSFAIAVFFWLLFRRYSKWSALLLIHAGLVAYSRVYLAKHYPGDILFGALLGIALGYLVYRLYILSEKKLLTRFTNHNGS